MGGSVKFAYKKIIEKVASSERGAKIIQTYADKKFTIAKQEFLKEFDEHPVTKSIEAGTQDPTVNYPAAGLENGNLFSFLGFEAGDSPIDNIRPILESETKLVKSSKNIVGNGPQAKVRINYSVRTPRRELAERSKLFWDSGLNFLYSIENGISGLSYFLSKKLRGRSGGGVQSPNPVRGGSDSVKSGYLNELLRGLVAKFRSL